MRETKLIASSPEMADKMKLLNEIFGGGERDPAEDDLHRRAYPRNPMKSNFITVLNMPTINTNESVAMKPSGLLWTAPLACRVVGQPKAHKLPDLCRIEWSLTRPDLRTYACAVPHLVTYLWRNAYPSTRNSNAYPSLETRSRG